MEKISKENVNKGRVRLLVAALRSGLYTQGRNRLHLITTDPVTRKVTDTWCCLGVGADVARRFGVEFESVTTGDGPDASIDGISERMGGTILFMPKIVMQWYGFDSGNPLLEGPDCHYSASGMNDEGYYEIDGTHHVATFEDIASAFERTYLKEDQ